MTPDPVKRRRSFAFRRIAPAVVVFGFGVALGAVLGQAVRFGDAVAVAAFVGAVVVASASDLVKDGIKKIAKEGGQIVSGRKSGFRRVEASRLSQTRVLQHQGGSSYHPEQWVDLSELDHRGFEYGVARSPTYILLFGNGLVRLEEIEIVLRPDVLTAELDEITGEATDLIEAKIVELAEENEQAGRPFLDLPVVRLVRWFPPIDFRSPLRIEVEAVGYHRYAATCQLLLNDRAGDLRRRFGVEPRAFDNPIVTGCIGVEIAVVTADEFVVIGHRGSVGIDYRNQMVVTVGEGMSPEDLADPDDETALDPWVCARRGLEEELLLTVKQHHVRFLALGNEVRRMDPDLLGYVHVPYSAQEVQESFLSARVRDRWENRTLSFVRFDPIAIADLLAAQPIEAFTPATAMNLAFMASDAFGETACQKAFAR